MIPRAALPESCNGRARVRVFYWWRWNAGKMFKVIKIKPKSGILLLCCLLLMPLPLLLLQ